MNIKVSALLYQTLKMKKPARIFISYCHQDREFLKGLHDHMVALRRDGSCAAWTDREIKAGDTLDKEIGDALEAANALAPS